MALIFKIDACNSYNALWSAKLILFKFMQYKIQK